MPEVEISVGKVFYEKAGEGFPVIFVHGNYGSWKWWKPILGKLEGYTTIALDLPCFGRSCKPETDHKIPTYAKYLDEFVKALGLEEFHLVGHSLGGAVAVQYALDFPEKVKKLVLVDPAPASGMHFPEEYKQMFKALKDNEDFLKQSLATLVPPSHELFGELLEDLFNMQYTAREGHVDALEEFNVVDKLKDLRAELYVIRGAKDIVVKDEDLKDYKKFAKRYIIMENVGHSPQLEDPEAFVKILKEILSE